MPDQPGRCPACLARGNPEYRCLLDKGHAGPHKDKHDNEWTMTVIVHEGP